MFLIDKLIVRKVETDVKKILTFQFIETLVHVCYAWKVKTGHTQTINTLIPVLKFSDISPFKKKYHYCRLCLLLSLLSDKSAFNSSLNVNMFYYTYLFAFDEAHM